MVKRSKAYVYVPPERPALLYGACISGYSVGQKVRSVFPK